MSLLVPLQHVSRRTSDSLLYSVYQLVVISPGKVNAQFTRISGIMCLGHER